MAIKICDLDLETGGLEKDVNPILQIACVIEIDGEIQEDFNMFVKPFEGQVIEDSALEKTGFDRDEIMDPDSKFRPPEEVYTAFIAMLQKYVNPRDRADKFQFCGYNCQSFDSQFLREFFLKCDDKFYGAYFSFPTRDLMQELGSICRHFVGELPNFQLGTVATLLGVKVESEMMHDGLYDARLVTEMRHWIDGLQSRVYSLAMQTDPDAVTMLSAKNLESFQQAMSADTDEPVIQLPFAKAKPLIAPKRL